MRFYYLFYFILMHFVFFQTQNDLSKQMFQYFESQKAIYRIRSRSDYSYIEKWLSQIENSKIEFTLSPLCLFDNFNNILVCKNDLRYLFEFYKNISLDLLIQLKSDSENFTEKQKLLAVSYIKKFLLCHITTINDNVLKDNDFFFDLFLSCFKISQYSQKSMEEFYDSLIKSQNNTFLENVIKDIIAFEIKEKKNGVCIAQESMNSTISENNQGISSVYTAKKNIEKNHEYFPLLIISCSFDKLSYDYNQFKFLIASSLVYYDKEFSFFITGKVRIDNFGSLSISIGEFFKNKICILSVIDYHLFLNFYISVSSRNFQSYFVGFTYVFKSSFVNIDCGGCYSI